MSELGPVAEIVNEVLGKDFEETPGCFDMALACVVALESDVLAEDLAVLARVGDTPQETQR